MANGQPPRDVIGRVRSLRARPAMSRDGVVNALVQNDGPAIGRGAPPLAVGPIPQPRQLHPQSEINPTYGVSNATLERARGRATHAAHVAGLQYQGPLQDRWSEQRKTGTETDERYHIGQFRQPDRSGFWTIADEALREERRRNVMRFARASQDSPGPGIRPAVEAGLGNVLPRTTPVDPRLGVTPPAGVTGEEQQRPRHRGAIWQKLWELERRQQGLGGLVLDQGAVTPPDEQSYGAVWPPLLPQA